MKKTTKSEFVARLDNLNDGKNFPAQLLKVREIA